MEPGRARRQLLAAALAVGWLVAALVALVAYVPGGPYDVGPALLRLIAAGLAAVAILRPPGPERDRRAVVTWLGIAALLLLIPTTWLLVRQPAPEAHLLVPAPEVLYAWFLALLGTAVFVALGVVRATRRRAALRSAALGTAVALAIATAGGAVVLANDAALAANPPATSPFGPTAVEPEPPPCSGELRAGSSARVTMELLGVVDRTETGTALLEGVRSGRDFAWTASLSTQIQTGERGVVRAGDRGWLLGATGSWRETDPAILEPAALDLRIVQTALVPGYRTVNETMGIDLVEGARARHCRIPVDGPTFLSAFPQITWFIGAARVDTWRGWLDYWVFGDSELGLVDGYIDGLAADVTPPGIKVTIHVRLTATDRGAELPIEPPVP